MEIPDPRYVQAKDGTYIAYQVVGDGSVDIAWGFDFFGDLDAAWEFPWQSAWFEGLASFGRLILHDRRATGLSSRNVSAPNLETAASDLCLVLDAAGSQSAMLGGWSAGLAPGVLLAATDPERVRALVWWNPTPRTVWGPDYPWGDGPDVVAAELEGLKHRGTIEFGRAWADHMEAT